MSLLSSYAVRLAPALFIVFVAAVESPAAAQQQPSQVLPGQAIPIYAPAPPVTRYAAPSAALGDLNGSGVPVISNPKLIDKPPVYSGAAMSPDGKILFVSAAGEFAHGLNNYLQNKGLFAAHVLHDQVTVDPVTGVADFGAGVDTPIKIINPTCPSVPSVECPQRQHTSFLAVIDDPELPATLTNPYRADCDSGAPDLAGNCQGYDFQVLINGNVHSDASKAFKWEVPLENVRTGRPATPAPGVSDLSWVFPPPPQAVWRVTQVILQRRLRLTVDLSASPSRIVLYEWLDGGAVSSMSFNAGNDNYFPLSGLEPTLSGDGRLMVWQGNPAQVAADDLGQIGGRCFQYWSSTHGLVPRSPCATGTFWGAPQGHGPCATPACNQSGDNPNYDQYFCLPGTPAGCSNTIPYFTQNVLVYAYRDDPTDPHGWSVPAHLTALHANTLGLTLAPYDGRTFHEIYPIARQPLVDGSGTPLVKINGNYCWLTLDATDVVWNAQAHIRTGIIGASTGFHLQHIDGPVNPTDFLSGSHNVDDRETFVGWGPTPGMWGPIDVGKRGVPYLQGSDRKMALYGHEVNNYVEIPLFAERPDRLLRLGMNKALREVPGPDEVPGGFHVQNDKTDDFSGRSQTGTLVGGAQFPAVHDGFNGLKSGESIAITGSGRIDVANGPDLNPVNGFDRGLSVGIFVRVDAAGGSRYLVRKNGSFEIVLLDDGRVRAKVINTVGANIFTTSVHTLFSSAVGDWHHVAFTRDGTHLRLYFDGVPESTAVRGGIVAGTMSQLEVGTEIDASPADITVDDLEIWGTTWTAAEVAELAYVEPAPSIFRDNPTLPGLPAGLDGDAQAFLKIPVGRQYDLTTERVGLGRKLFADPGLSHSSLNMSCATCHQPGFSFAESANGGFSFDSSGGLLPRQTPPDFNRAFGDTQLWDAKAPSLEAQASMPILSSDEMNNTQSAVEAYIQANYATPAQTGDIFNFQDAYGTSVPVLSDLELALAAYQRNVVAGGSVIDDYEDGIPISGPDANAILRGRKLFFTKARCAACHQGPNLSDNLLHRTVATSTDAGAGALSLRLEDDGAFKTPTLRRIDETVDYFHNGSEITLSGVVDVYESGGASGDPEIRPLGLTAAERADLVKFLEALDSGIIELF